MKMHEYLESLDDKQLDGVMKLVQFEMDRRKRDEWDNLVAKVAKSAPLLPKDIADKIKSGEIVSSSYCILDPEDRKAHGIIDD